MSKSKKKLNQLDDSFLSENKIIFKKYKPIKEIGNGAFGKIYSTIRIEDKSVYAMKTEKRTPFSNILETEAYFLFILKGLGIPQLISYGHNTKYNILIETLLGKSLYDIFLKTKKHCHINDICLIAIQIIERLQFIHSKDIIYRDVKPENLLIGIEDPNIIYIIDYGLCKKYRSSKTGKHILPKDIKKFIGTLKYSSSNVVKGKEASRRDDLISLGFVLIYLYKRNLPWSSKFKGLDEENYFKTIHAKETFDDGNLFKYLPEEMVNFLKYVNNLRFEEDPDYSYMKGCFQKILTRLNIYKTKVNFSWINSEDIKLAPKLKYHKREGSRIRLLKSLENNRQKRNTLDADTINTPREIGHHFKNTFDENVKKINEKKTNNINLIEYKNQKQIHKVNKIRNQINPMQKYNNNTQNQRKAKISQNKNIYINDNNNNIVLNYINVGNNINKNMNFNITYHRKINTFVPTDIYINNLRKINYKNSKRDNYTNINNNYINNNHIINNINNSHIKNSHANNNIINSHINSNISNSHINSYINKDDNINNNYSLNGNNFFLDDNIRTNKTMNISDNKNYNILNSFDINKKKILQNKLLQEKKKKNNIIIFPNNNFIKLENSNAQHMRIKQMSIPNVKITHSHNYTGIE